MALTWIDALLQLNVDEMHMEVDSHTQQTIIINTMQTNKMLMLILHTFFFCFIITSSIQSNETLVSSSGAFETEFFNFVISQLQYFSMSNVSCHFVHASHLLKVFSSADDLYKASDNKHRLWCRPTKYIGLFK
ncbi:hypothetical protein MtrunA17_Chr6g0472541 [Medicago truncatula]|uniref:Uncharacterized protein n=1 Tax=Medicago truncatula TaxID=3880 RepID=A0A072TJP4_MEDTR|nr:hypothetical protein MTR_0019s0010 [Medicago truncatula]RHN51764.1 hypothetical protein MtrunA17_Chr6g0472541 [Medicago truncatula]